MIYKKFKHCRIDTNRLIIWYKLYTFEIYWAFFQKRDNTYGIWAKTCMVFANPKNWSWIWSFAVVILGFGLGISYNHCDNPNYDADLHKKYEKEIDTPEND